MAVTWIANGYMDYYISNIGFNPLLHGSAEGTFTEITQQAGAAGEFGWGTGFEDFNGDGWLDIFVAQEDDRDYLTFTNLGTSPPTFSEQRWSHAVVGGRPQRCGRVCRLRPQRNDRHRHLHRPAGSRVSLYSNDTDPGTTRWLEVRVPNTPGTGEHGGISGRVVVKTGDVVQYRDLTGGASRASQHAMSVRFGLGHWTGAEWVAVLWPDGRQMAALGGRGQPDAGYAHAVAGWAVQLAV